MPSRATPALLTSTSTWSHLSMTAVTKASQSATLDRSAGTNRNRSGSSCCHFSTSGVMLREQVATRSPESR